MIEAGVVLDIEGKPLYWHLPPGRSGGSLPDSRPLWDVFWQYRERVGAFAHSHPGSGMPGPSYTDVTTFAAIEAALGKRLIWWITSADSVVLLRWKGPHPHSYEALGLDKYEPSWVPELRRLSAEGAGR